MKIMFILHKMNCDPIDIQMINWNTDRAWYGTKTQANKGLDIMEKNKSFLYTYIDNKKIICKGVITDWPHGIPDLFDAMDDMGNVLKMERLTRRIWDNNAKIMKRTETGNIKVTVGTLVG